MSPVGQQLDWEDQFRRLEAFQRQFGHCRVPKHSSELQPLLRWMADQVSGHWSLSLEQVRRLYDLGFPFPTHDRHWLRRYFELVEFRQAHGHCAVPWNWPQNPTLNTWCGTQRCARHRMSSQRRRRLDEIGFVWDMFELKWERCFERLKAFYEARGRLNVSRSEHRLILAWASHQRTRRNDLTAEQVQKLDKLGFDWEPFNNLWRGHIKGLKAFKKRFGHCYVPQSWNEPTFLGGWVHEVRCKREKLSPERIAELDQIGFAWDFREFAGLDDRTHAAVEPIAYTDGLWMKRYGELKEFIATHGHCRVPAKWPPNPSLATWVVRQRSWREKLAPERREKLDALGFCWTPFEEHSLEMLEKLSAFKREHGHCNVPTRYPVDPSLSDWVQRQRERFHGHPKHTPLPAELRERLEELGFDWRLRDRPPRNGPANQLSDQPRN